MRLKDAQKNWDLFGKIDPLGSILTVKGKKWEVDEFFRTGEKEISGLMKRLGSIGLTIGQKKALDFGCGIGRLTQALAPYFKEVRGVDIAPSMINLAQSHNKHGNRCQYYVNRGDDLRIFPDKSFDLILSKITLQHIEPVYGKNYIKEFVRVAKPGGIIVFQMPSAPVLQETKSIGIKDRVRSLMPESWLNIYRKIKLRRKPVTEMYGMSRKEIEDLLEKCGAKLIDVRQDQSAGEKWISWQYCAVV